MLSERSPGAGRFVCEAVVADVVFGEATVDETHSETHRPDVGSPFVAGPLVACREGSSKG
jgi:hypothetical protein